MYAKVSTETQALKGLLEAFPGDADTVAQAEYCSQTLKQAVRPSNGAQRTRKKAA